MPAFASIVFTHNFSLDRPLVAFVDIAAPNYQGLDHGGVEFADAMSRIHAVLPDGTVIKNVAVFRQVYQVLGIGWIYAATGWPVIGPLVDKLYDFWADRRLTWTGRPDLATILAAREQGCDDQRCAVGSER